MIKTGKFVYEPGEHEAEKASNSYLMSLIAVIAGLPFPIVNLIATVIFFIANKKGTYFVRWHCIQALLSQFSLFFMNSFAFWWTIYILFGEKTITNNFMAYLITVFFFNLLEFIATIYTAINTRKGMHIEWLFYGNLTNIFCKA